MCAESGDLNVVEESSDRGGHGCGECEAAASVSEYFDLLALTPRGPKRFHRNNPQAPSDVYTRGEAVVYVGAFVAAGDAGWLGSMRVRLVVSVLGRGQKLPRVPSGVVHFHFRTERWDDAEQWRALFDVLTGVMDDGASVLIHCMAGIHRAPMCTAGVLSIMCQVCFQDAF